MTRADVVIKIDNTMIMNILAFIIVPPFVLWCKVSEKKGECKIIGGKNAG
jgi:hypothetical protein